MRDEISEGEQLWNDSVAADERGDYVEGARLAALAIEADERDEAAEQ